MNRELISVSDIREKENRFARLPEYQELYRRCFENDILPDRIKSPRYFTDEEIFAHLYQHERESNDNIARLNDYHYEKEIDKKFWHRKDNNRVLCITGTIGSGKSTLIDYYLRCYCRHQGEHREEFETKFIIHVNVQSINDENSWRQVFYQLLQESIRQQCRIRNIDINRLAKEKGDTVPYWGWVNCALESLSDLCYSTDYEFKYIVIVVDNLDQVRQPMQEKIVGIIERWSNSTELKIWRIILPMWPSTYFQYKKPNRNLLRNSEELKIGVLDPEMLLSKRKDGFSDEIEKALQSSVADVDIRDMRSYLQFIIPYLIQSKVHQLVRGLKCSDLRSELRLLGEMVSSDICYIIWQHFREQPDSKREFDYNLKVALISGKYETYHADSSSIANIFRASSKSNHSRDLFAGYLGLLMLEKCGGEMGTWKNKLKLFGFTDSDCKDIYHYYHLHNFFYELPGRHNDDPLMHIHNGVMIMYNSLIVHPSYIDCMAVVTPIPEELHGSMKRSFAGRIQEFAQRVETALVFMNYLDREEDSFVDSLRAFRPELKKDINELKVLNLSKKIAHQYKARITALQKENISNLPPHWWNKVLSQLDIIIDKGDYMSI
ncbi:MAG: AAA family ATPase [Gemmataceae bacterium]